MSKQLDLDSLDGILPLAGAAKIEPPAERTVATMRVGGAPVPDDAAATVQVAPETLATLQSLAASAITHSAVTAVAPRKSDEASLRAVTVSSAVPAAEERTVQAMAPAPVLAKSARWPWLVLGVSAMGVLFAVVALTRTQATPPELSPIARAPAPAAETPTAIPAEKVTAAEPEAKGASSIDEASPPAPERPQVVQHAEPAPELPHEVAGTPMTELPSFVQKPLVFPATFRHDEVDAESLDAEGIAGVTRWLSLCSGVVVVVGHTSSVGSSDANYHVGLGRAISVRRYLLDNHLARRKIRVASRGASEPLASNTIAGGRTANRRVELQCQTQ